MYKCFFILEDQYQGVKPKGFYLIPYTIAHETLLLSPLYILPHLGLLFSPFQTQIVF